MYTSEIFFIIKPEKKKKPIKNKNWQKKTPLEGTEGADSICLCITIILILFLF